MSDIDPNTIRHAFTTLEETARWCEVTAAALRRLQEVERQDNANKPEQYGGPEDEEYLDIRLSLANAERLAEHLEQAGVNIRGATGDLLGRVVQS